MKVQFAILQYLNESLMILLSNENFRRIVVESYTNLQMKFCVSILSEHFGY